MVPLRTQEFQTCYLAHVVLGVSDEGPFDATIATVGAWQFGVLGSTPTGWSAVTDPNSENVMRRFDSCESGLTGLDGTLNNWPLHRKWSDPNDVATRSTHA